MRDLVRESGFPRATIHFYQQQGLLPEAREKLRNSAVYGPEHLERLARIRQLRDQQFLPLRAIRAIFQGIPKREFTPDQERFLRSMRAAHTSSQQAEPGSARRLEELGTQVQDEELAALRSAGLIEPANESATLSPEDAEILTAWSDLKAIGIGPERGFAATEVGLFERATEGLVEEEFALFIPRFADVSGSAALAIVERAQPILERLLVASHRKKIRQFIDRER
jgi:DNA-binding transcriptional MerR regulator